MEQLLTPSTLAAFLGIAEQTIYNRHSTGGDLPTAIKVGRLLRFDPVEVKAWLQNKSKPCASQATQSAPTRRRGRPTKAEQIARRSATGYP